VYLVHKITGERQDQKRKDKQTHIQDRAPHKEARQHMNIHDVPPLSFYIQNHGAGPHTIS